MNGTYEGGTRAVAFLFSGQGSQHVGMGASLYRTEPVYRDAFDRCAELLVPHLGVDIRDIVFASASDTSINETRFTQPALFATEYALASLWMARGITPAAMLGHSIGEYVAAHLAGVMTLDDALAVVAARGRLMQELPAGSMAAVGLPASELERLVLASPGVEIAAFNAPNLCTVSGPSEAVAALGTRLGTIGEYRPLHTSHAFHSAMMEPALAPFTGLLRRIALSPPRIPYVSNLTGTWITDEQAVSPDYYAKHLRHAVKFDAGVRTLSADPATLLLEVGPGNALTSLARLTLGRDANKRVFSSLAHVKEQRTDTEATLEATARLWMSGAGIDWRRFHARTQPRRIPLPTYPFERVRCWVDPEPAATAASPIANAPRSIDSSLFAPTWSRDDTPVEAPRLAGAWLVLAHPDAFSAAVVERLTDAGASVVMVEPGADFASVVRGVRASGRIVSGAVHLLSAESGDGTDLARSYHSLVALAIAMEPASGATARIIVATSGTASVLAEAVQFPERAMVLGPVLSLPHEIIGLGMRAVDIDLESGHTSVDVAASALVREAANGDGESVVAHRAGRRWVRRFEPVSLAPATDKLPLEQRGLYLITGGTGGIGLAVARALATHASARLLLT
ncbi:MAG TPA: acyltransferase domain-containing protein, partial [Gemmatimonadaceae bacterium]